MDQDLKTAAISIVMLSYNRAKYIGTAIESVLEQNFTDWELLIIDGGSRDNTELVISPYLKDPRIRLVKPEKDLGIAGNRNIGLRMAKGEYAAVLDSDDVWIDPDKLSKQFQFLEENKDHVLVGTNFEMIDENGRTVGRVRNRSRDPDIRQNLLLRNEFAHSSVVFRRAPALSGTAGAYDPSLFIWEDYDLWLRIGQLGKMANLADVTLAYRVHPGATSASRKIKGSLTMISIIKRYRHSYPNFYLAFVKGWLRVLARAIDL